MPGSSISLGRHYINKWNRQNRHTAVQHPVLPKFMKYSPEKNAKFWFDRSNILGGVGPAPPLSAFQQVTINQLNDRVRTLQTQLDETLSDNTHLRQKLNDVQVENQTIRNELDQLKIDFKLLLLKLKPQSTPSQPHEEGGGGGSGANVV